jgi:hypothetical protein
MPVYRVLSQVPKRRHWGAGKGVNLLYLATDTDIFVTALLLLIRNGRFTSEADVRRLQKPN